jgi:hypothetical protein
MDLAADVHTAENPGLPGLLGQDNGDDFVVADGSDLLSGFRRLDGQCTTHAHLPRSSSLAVLKTEKRFCREASKRKAPFRGHFLGRDDFDGELLDEFPAETQRFGVLPRVHLTLEHPGDVLIPHAQDDTAGLAFLKAG